MSTHPLNELRLQINRILERHSIDTTTPGGKELKRELRVAIVRAFRKGHESRSVQERQIGYTEGYTDAAKVVADKAREILTEAKANIDKLHDSLTDIDGEPI
jgi:hypothetical protein